MTKLVNFISHLLVSLAFPFIEKIISRKEVDAIIENTVKEITKPKNLAAIGAGYVVDRIKQKISK